MRRTIQQWTVDQLKKRFISIRFPEYQREANVWATQDKQALIDSILRDFDIACLYFYTNDDGSWDCIDGRQRIHALMAFLGVSELDNERDYRFAIRNTNEIDPNEDHPFPALDGMTFEDIRARADQGGGEHPEAEVAREAKDKILQFAVTVVLLSEANNESEFNLQFTRLNLGTPINAAEKLHAMTGAMKELCFNEDRIGQHPFVLNLGIPKRRFAKQLTAAQILAQAFSKGLGRDGGFMRTRHWDLQDFFKEQFEVDETDEALVEEVKGAFDALNEEIPNAKDLLRNRAIAVTLALHVWETKLYEDQVERAKLSGFVAALLDDLKLLRAELNSPEAVSEDLMYLVDFQRHLTQASVERRAVEERAVIIGELFRRWVDHGQIRRID